MDTSHQQLIEQLQSYMQPVTPQDTMAEAGRKALIPDFIKMLQNEDAARVSDGAHAIHDMRVGTRRMRSTLRLLSAYFKPKAIKDHLEAMRAIAEALGKVRDLDVMIEEISRFGETLAAKDDLQPILDQLQAQQAKARKSLVRVLDKRAYRRFIDDFSAFLTKPGKGAVPVDADEIRPFQVRHLLPELTYEHLGAVRAYEDVLAEADDLVLHDLRIEIKRLRYAVAIFSPVLGSSIGDFIEELKLIQDHLGKLNDLHTAQERLGDLARKLDPNSQAETLAALQQYIEHLEEERHTLHTGLGDVWRHFNTKTVQRHLANAVTSL